jgi:hypothetical protein
MQFEAEVEGLGGPATTCFGWFGCILCMGGPGGWRGRRGCRLLTWNTAPRGVAAALPTPTPASMAWLDSMPRT